MNLIPFLRFWAVWILLFIGTFVVQASGGFNIAPPDNLFADSRIFCGVSHGLDVWTNLAFILAGLYGLIVWKKHASQISDNSNQLIIIIGSVLVAIGSSFYHLHPDNHHLVWDRLPMAIVFSGLFCFATIRLNLYPLKKQHFSIAYLVFSVATVLLWFFGTVIHVNLIAPYVFLQFVGMILFVMLAYMAYKNSDNPLFEALFGIIFFYAVAKIFEYYDFEIFSLTHGLISGHSIKHLVAAVALFYWFFKSRKMM
jgi:uncharacterized protein YjeT (DUF2065 family)